MKDHFWEAGMQALLAVVAFVVISVVMMIIVDPSNLTSIVRMLGWVSDGCGGYYDARVEDDIKMIFLLLFGMWAIFWLFRFVGLRYKDREEEMWRNVNNFINNHKNNDFEG